MRKPSLSLLSFAALSASLAEGAVVDTSPASSAPSSRRSSVQLSSSLSTTGSSSSTPGHGRIAITPVAVEQSRVTSTTSSSASSSSFDGIEPTPVVVAANPRVPIVAVVASTKTSTPARNRIAITAVQTTSSVHTSQTVAPTSLISSRSSSTLVPASTTSSKIVTTITSRSSTSSLAPSSTVVTPSSTSKLTLSSSISQATIHAGTSSSSSISPRSNTPADPSSSTPKSSTKAHSSSSSGGQQASTSAAPTTSAQLSTSTISLRTTSSSLLPSKASSTYQNSPLSSSFVPQLNAQSTSIRSTSTTSALSTIAASSTSTSSLNLQHLTTSSTTTRGTSSSASQVSTSSAISGFSAPTASSTSSPVVSSAGPLSSSTSEIPPALSLSAPSVTTLTATPSSSGLFFPAYPLSSSSGTSRLVASTSAHTTASSASPLSHSASSSRSAISDISSRQSQITTNTSTASSSQVAGISVGPLVAKPDTTATTVAPRSTAGASSFVAATTNALSRTSASLSSSRSLLGTISLDSNPSTTAVTSSSVLPNRSTSTAAVRGTSSSSILSARAAAYSSISGFTTSSMILSSSKPSAPPSTVPSSASASSAAPTQKASVSAVASYIDLGCWYDSGSARTFDGASFKSPTNMTTELCASFCTAHNQPFSGTEYGDECYCSDTAPASYAAWWCSMPCAGNSTEICGNGNALSVLYSAAITDPSSSTALGCFGDAVSERTMTGPSFSSSSLTNEICVSFCTAQGYPYSGTEYGDQCYCSDVAPWSASVGCGMACAGNSSEICGDGDALAVTYTRNSTSAVASTSTNGTSTTSKSHTTVDLSATFSSWSSWKARGVNLGNWLVLEEWMYSSWFDATAPGAVDEWTFCQTLGSNCTSVLQNHWQTWVTESDIATIANAKANTLRIPIGFWAFVDPLASEPYVRSTQLVELTRVLGYAQTYGMTVIVDLHGLPGSQNGQDHSGHAGTIGFYSADNQARALQTVQAAATWIANSGFAGTTISALEVANEPAIANWEVWLQYKDYVVQAHEIIQATIPSVATMFHDGFWEMSPWNQFFTASDNAVIDTHKYWAFSPTTIADAEADVCSYIGEFDSLNLPVFVGEFSLSVEAPGANVANYALGFFESQMSVWLQYAGAAFWSLKVFNADGVTQNTAWSVEGVIESGLLDANVWDFANSTCTSD